MAKGRARIGMIGNKARAFTPPKTVAYEALVAMTAHDAMDGSPPLEGPLKVEIVAWFIVPASWSKRRKAETRYHTARPDADNIGKAIGDGANGIVWRDDAQIASFTVTKRYGAQACVAVAVSEL